MALIFTLLAAGFSYLVYTDELSVGSAPWIIGMLLALFCAGGPFVVAFISRGSNALRACGIVVTVAMFAVYYFFGIVCYFYYFLFSPMPAAMHWPGLLGGIALTARWIMLAYKSVRHTIDKTSFVAKAFADNGDHYAYNIAEAGKLYERFNSERSPFPKVLMYVVMGIAPFYLILSRLLSESFGANGVLLFLAVLGMPMSLWSAGMMVRTYLIMIALPGKLERETGKSVVVVE